MAHKARTLLLHILLFSLTVSTALAQENELQVKLVTGDSYFPFVSEPLPDGGWSNAIVKSVFKEMGVYASIEVVPWSRGEKWTRESRYLGTFPYVFSEKRGKDYLFSSAINYVPIRIFTSQSSGIQHQAQLYGKRLCLPHGYLLSQSIKKLKNLYSLSINRAKNTAACFGHVEKGWSDIGLINGYFNKAHITDVFEQSDAFVILKEPLETVPLFFIVSRQYPDAQDWINKFNSALNQLEQKGKLASLNHMYKTLLKDSYVAKGHN